MECLEKWSGEWCAGHLWFLAKRMNNRTLSMLLWWVVRIKELGCRTAPGIRKPYQLRKISHTGMLQWAGGIKWFQRLPGIGIYWCWNLLVLESTGSVCTCWTSKTRKCFTWNNMCQWSFNKKRAAECRSTLQPSKRYTKTINSGNSSACMVLQLGR